MFDDEFEERESKKIIIRIIVASVCFVAVLAVAVVLIFKTFGGKDGGDETPGIEGNVDGQPTGDESAGNREDSKSQENTDGQPGDGSQEGTGAQTGGGSPEKPEDDGIKTKFSDCQEQVTPKIEINLRSIPSVTNPNSVVVATLHAGEVFVRTGINTELGWSRVEYNGQVLYCVSSYLNVVE